MTRLVGIYEWEVSWQDMAISMQETLGSTTSRDWEPRLLAEMRSAAALAYSLMDMPDEAEEDWRYTDVSAIDIDSYAVAMPSMEEPVDFSVRDDVLARTFDALSGGAKSLDGSIVAQTLDRDLRADGLLFGSAETCADAFARWKWSDPPLQRDKLTALAVASAGGGAYLSVPEGLELANPFWISVVCETEKLLTAPYSRIRLEPRSSARLVIHRYGAPVSRSLHLPITEISVGNDASLELLVIQEFNSLVDEIGLVSAVLEGGSSAKIMTVVLGGGISRQRTEIRLIGERSESEMLGLSYARGDSHVDHRTLQEHSASFTESDLLFKTVVDDSASSVYSGLIRVERDVKKVTGYQANRNLILSDKASAESIPNLEILANDVRCSHASATGPLDEDQLYYIESRGISPETAERLIVSGFLGELLDRSPVAELRETLRSQISKVSIGGASD